VNANKRLVKLAWKSGTLLPLSVITGVAAGSLVALQSWYLSSAIDGLFLKRLGISESLPMLQAVFWLILIRAVFTFLTNWLSGRLAESVKLQLRKMLLEKVGRLGPAWVKRQKSGEITTTFLQGTESLENYYSLFLPQVIQTVIIPLIILIIVFPVDALTGVVFVVTAPLIPIFMILIGRLAENITGRQWQQLHRMGDFLLDSIKGLKTLLLLGRNDQRLDEIKKVSENYRVKTLNVLKITFLSAFTLEMVATIATALVAVQIGLRLLYGNLDFKESFFILLLAPEFYLPMRNLSMRYHSAMTGIEAANSIFSILDSPETASGHYQLISFVDRDPKGQKIVFQKLSYRYPESNQDVLSQFSFIFLPGRHYAICGPNGAGKSTILNLLLRFIRPDSGSIIVGTNDISLWSSSDWRRHISYINQKPSLFNTTLLENVRLFDPTYSEDQVLNALERASLDKLVRSLPEGLHTQMMELGARFSAGERQRLAIARAFLKNAAIVLMDEPTSHLDAELNEEMLGSIDLLISGRTSITVAHHLPLIKMADEILYMSQGKLIKSGNFSTMQNMKMLTFDTNHGGDL
jgi:ATP-binding cassette subfamily C protein CydD